MAVAITVDYVGDLHCRARHEPSRELLLTDAPLDNGGKGERFSPTDLVATGLATCALTVLGLVARRHGLDLEGTQARVIKEMTSEPVRRIGALQLHVTLPPSLQLSAEQKALFERAVHACPVRQSLHPDVRVSIDIVFPAGEA